MAAVARRAYRRGVWTWTAVCVGCRWEHFAGRQAEAGRFRDAHNDVHHAPTGARK